MTGPRPRPSPKPPRPRRTVRLLRPPSQSELGIFRIASGKQVIYYVFREIPCTVGGRGFLVQQVGTRISWAVRVGRPQDCSCECLGFLYGNRCRHVQGLLTLIRHGEL
ncbi:MAG: SWIM zinc finger family protein [Gemmataceae bacterium]|nr:SWIM zinc finger family protein [Gemmataceae bacterium]MDW8266924.1 SWIM zinc finger family protein [Gemmataceae bacterium]